MRIYNFRPLSIVHRPSILVTRSLLVGFILLVMLTACATTGGWFNDSNTNARILTKGIVAEYLAHNKSSIDAVYQVSTDALTYVKTGIVTVDQLETFVVKAIAPSLSKMTPEGQAAVAVMIGELKAQLVKQLPANNVDPTKTQIEIITFLTWINDVAKTYHSAGI
jgi:hypothetical protein